LKAAQKWPSFPTFNSKPQKPSESGIFSMDVLFYQ